MCEIGFLHSSMFVVEESAIIIIYYCRLQKHIKFIGATYRQTIFPPASPQHYKSIFRTQTLLTVIAFLVISP